MSFLVLRLVIAGVLAFAGYGWAGRFEQRYGYTPWRLHKGVWALLFGLGLLIGAVCGAIAESQAKKEYARRAALPPPPPGYAPAGNPMFGQPMSAYPQPAYPQPAYPQPAPPAPPAVGPTPPA